MKFRQNWELGSISSLLSFLITKPVLIQRHGKISKGRFYARQPVDPIDILDRAELAVTTLLQKPASSLRFSRELRYETRNDLSWNGGPFQRTMIRATGGSSGMAVVWGALLTTMMGIPILLCIFSETVL